MFTNFFQARAALDAAIRADEITLAAPSLAIFRLLLEHAWFDDTYGRYGFVNDGDSGVRGIDDIAKLTGYSVRAVKDHLRALEEAKLIHRQPRPKWSGGRDADEIAIVWTTFHDPYYEAEGASPALSGQSGRRAEGAAPASEGAARSTEGAPPAPSFLSKKEKNNQKGQPPSGDNRAKDSTRDDLLAEIDSLFPAYVNLWSDRSEEEAREVADSLIRWRIERGHLGEVLAEMKRDIAKNEAWLAAQAAKVPA